jgi:hypothetical protein
MRTMRVGFQVALLTESAGMGLMLVIAAQFPHHMAVETNDDRLNERRTEPNEIPA